MKGQEKHLNVTLDTHLQALSASYVQNKRLLWSYRISTTEELFRARSECHNVISGNTAVEEEAPVGFFHYYENSAQSKLGPIIHLSFS